MKAERDLAATLRGKLWLRYIRYKNYFPACSYAYFSSVSIRLARLADYLLVTLVPLSPRCWRSYNFHSIRTARKRDQPTWRARW